MVGSDPGIRTIVSKAQFKLSSVLLFGASVMLAVWAIATWLQQGKFDTALRKVFERDSSADVTVFWVGLMYLAGPFFSAVFAIAYAFLATKIARNPASPPTMRVGARNCRSPERPGVGGGCARIHLQRQMVYQRDWYWAG